MESNPAPVREIASSFFVFKSDSLPILPWRRIYPWAERRRGSASSTSEGVERAPNERRKEKRRELELELTIPSASWKAASSVASSWV